MITKELLNPKSIAVIGGSNDINKPGGRALHNLLTLSTWNSSNLFVVNPKDDSVQGIKCYKSISDLPNVDFAVVCIAAQFVEVTIKELCKTKSTKAIIIVSAGFSEVGHEGKLLEERIVQICNNNNCALIGPNCIGMLTPAYQAVIAGPIPKLENSGCDFVSSSGATAVYIIEEAIARGLSFASVYSVGNGAQISVEDVVEYWDDTYQEGISPKIKMIYIESVGEPAKLLKHSRSLISKGAKICAVKSGRSSAGSRAATSHTGALAGSDTAVEALFKKAGIIRCEGRFDLVDVATILKNKELNGQNIAIITHAGGPGVMLTDTLESVGFTIPKIEGEKADELRAKLFYGASTANPIDCLVTGTPEHIAEILYYVDNVFDNIDAACIIYGNSGLFSPEEVYKVVAQLAKTCKKPVYHIIPSPYRTPELTNEVFANGHSIFTDEVAFGKALGKVYEQNNLLKKQINPLKKQINLLKKQINSVIEQADNGYLPPAAVQELLDLAGIPRAKEIVASTATDAVKAATEIGYPLVMKVVGLVHKSDVGGVRLNIKDETAVLAAFSEMMHIKDAVGVLLQPMLSGTELYVGAKREDKFGHLVLCGLGGIYIEVLKDINYGLVPINSAEAEDMVHKLRSYKLLEGVRGQEGVNIEAFIDVIMRVSALLEATPEIAEMDINPLLGNKAGIVAVDARIRIER